MKVIDLLNKIANGEETSKKIKYKDIIFDYKKEKGDYESEEGQFFLDLVELNKYGLHDEVEIIEEDKKIEKFEFGEIEDGEHYEIKRKINEIIDKLNEMEKE